MRKTDKVLSNFVFLYRLPTEDPKINGRPWSVNVFLLLSKDLCFIVQIEKGEYQMLICWMMDESFAQVFHRLERVKNHKNRGKWALGLSRDEPSHKQFGNVAMFLRYFTIARTRCWHGTALSIPDLPLFPSIKSPFSNKKSSDALPPMKAATNKKSTQFCSHKFLHDN